MSKIRAWLIICWPKGRHSAEGIPLNIISSIENTSYKY